MGNCLSIWKYQLILVWPLGGASIHWESHQLFHCLCSHAYKDRKKSDKMKVVWFIGVDKGLWVKFFSFPLIYVTVLLLPWFHNHIFTNVPCMMFPLEPKTFGVIQNQLWYKQVLIQICVDSLWRPRWEARIWGIVS